MIPGATAADSVAPLPAASQATGEPHAGPIPTQNLLEMILSGGPLMPPILVCSFVFMLVVFERTISLRRGRVSPRPFVKRMLHQVREGSLGRDDALARCREDSSHVARVFAAAIRKWGKPAVEVEQAVLDEGERIANELRRYLRVINGIATVCPLLGLLGTVWGMMEAFNAISTNYALGRAELLAGGISGALVSTAAGLFVAIPALIAYLFFVGRVDRLIMDIDARGQQLVELISAEGISERKEKPAKEKKAA
jgi:biopolymer transport protein ExbB